jgi:hypothetical protein
MAAMVTRTSFIRKLLFCVKCLFLLVKGTNRDNSRSYAYRKYLSMLYSVSKGSFISLYYGAEQKKLKKKKIKGNKIKIYHIEANFTFLTD